jgi:hypothetical protein
MPQPLRVHICSFLRHVSLSEWFVLNARPFSSTPRVGWSKSLLSIEPENINIEFLVVAPGKILIGSPN